MFGTRSAAGKFSGDAASNKKTGMNDDSVIRLALFDVRLCGSHAALGKSSYATAAAGIVEARAINQRLRRGLSTNIASNAPIQSNAIANIKIGYQRPVLPAIKLPIGTSNDAVPLAVYSKP